MRLRQVCLLAEELECTIATLTRLFDAEVCFQDPAVAVFGLVNALVPMGSDFLEVVSPAQGDCAGRRQLDRRGPGGYMLIFQVADGRAARNRALARNAEAVWQHDENGIHATHFHPRSLPGAIVSVDSMEDEGRDYRRPDSRWDWAGPNWKMHRRDDGNLGLAGAVVESHDPGATAERWQDVLGLSSSRADPRTLQLEGGELVFEASEGAAPEFSSFSVRHRDVDSVLARAAAMDLPLRGRGVQVAGVWIELEPPPER